MPVVHVTLTRVKTADQEPVENASIVAEEMERWLREVEGFRGFVMLSRPGTSIGLSFWESSDAAEKHLVSRSRLVERMQEAADVEVEERLDFTVTFARLAPDALDGTP
jgi:hypothetical protein